MYRQPQEDTQLIISGDEVFYSFQGEGDSIGCPAVFLRLHHCNLSCSWCDTRYTWDATLPEYHQERKVWSIIEVAEQIYQRQRANCHRLVITGGEPLIQQKSLVKLIELLPDWIIEIETNGTIIPVSGLYRCQFNCSPKLSNSDVPFEKRFKKDALGVLGRLNTCFKFVIKRPEDIDELERDYGRWIDKEKIILSPESISAEDMQSVMQSIAEVAMQRGYRLLPRLQVLLWGNQRGR